MLLVSPEPLVLLDRLEMQVFRVHLEQMDNQDLLDLSDQLVHKVTQECKVPRDLKDQLEILV